MLVPTRVFFPGVTRGEFVTTGIMLEDVRAVTLTL